MKLLKCVSKLKLDILSFSVSSKQTPNFISPILFLQTLEFTLSSTTTLKYKYVQALYVNNSKTFTIPQIIHISMHNRNQNQPLLPSFPFQAWKFWTLSKFMDRLKILTFLFLEIIGFLTKVWHQENSVERFGVCWAQK